MGLKPKTLVGIVAVAAVLAAIAVAASQIDPSATPEVPVVDVQPGADQALPETVHIGGLISLTGERANRGEDYKTAANIGVEDFNQYLEESGQDWRLKIIIEDTATNPVVALDKLASLKAKNIDIIIGPQTSAEARNVMSYAEYNGMLLVSTGSTTPTLAIPGDNLYRLIPDDSTQGHVLARLLWESGITVVVPIWRGDAWGDGLHDVFAREFAVLGGTVDEGIRYSPEIAEFSSSVSLLASKVREHSQDTGLDQVAVLDISFTELVQLMQSASHHDVLDDVRWFGASAIVKDKHVVDDKMSSKFAEDVGFVAMQFAPSQTEKYADVHDKLVSALGRVPNAYAFATYDSIWIIGYAIQQTQGTDMQEIKEVIPAIASEYSGAIGSTKLNEAGDLINNDYEVWGVQDGDWVSVGLYDSATDSVTLQDNN